MNMMIGVVGYMAVLIKNKPLIVQIEEQREAVGEGKWPMEKSEKVVCRDAVQISRGRD